ncbi:hypothetical protein BKA59DRAFT_472249 [Fusarium tricinctum]|jgi:hypothetical protein|uniref:DUF7703 domain-containing protein n=2 Tax=Fusarium tricinctum species complex TaxID=679429 RepID=A0A8K0WCQ6_9HYPO|nr:hypothetical protein BKA59DRAFT_472249 [Fusarium tricinctum]
MGYSGSEDEHGPSVSIPIAVCMALSLYNVVELNVLILTTFKTRGSLYFWSFVAATNGIAPHTIGFLLKNLVLSENFVLYITLISIGWVFMVTGQSLVLYSRLHLIFWNQFHLKLVLTMIIVNAVVLHLPIIVLMYGSNSSEDNPWVHPYKIYEKIQVTVFFLQELIISALYIKACSSFFGTEGLLHRKGVRRMRKHLLLVNVIIILLDIPILVLEFADFYDFQTAYKALVYSIKLKLEFNLLNSLVEVAQGSDAIGSRSGNQIMNNLRLSVFEEDRPGSAARDCESNGVGGGMDTKRRKATGSSSDGRMLVETGISVAYIERREDDEEHIGHHIST